MTNKFGNYFGEQDTDVLQVELNQTRRSYLKMSLDAYKQADSCNNTSQNQIEGENPDSNSATSYGSTSTEKQQAYETEHKEEWLHNYMFAKIKEKLDVNFIECIEHYIQVSKLRLHPVDLVVAYFQVRFYPI